jgi:hypothetical protein
MVGPWLGTLALVHYGAVTLWIGMGVLGLISAVVLART